MRKTYLFGLFKYSPLMCFAVVGYFILHIFLNIKSGLLIAPINHFGMYSGKMHVPDTIQTTVVYVNGIQASPKQCSIVEWDKIMLYPSAYQKHRMINKEVNQTFSRIFPFPQFEVRDSATVDTQFNAWYKQMLTHTLAQKINSVTVYNVPCVWRNEAMKISGKKSIIFQL